MRHLSHIAWPCRGRQRYPEPKQQPAADKHLACRRGSLDNRPHDQDHRPAEHAPPPAPPVRERPAEERADDVAQRKAGHHEPHVRVDLAANPKVARVRRQVSARPFAR